MLDRFFLPGLAALAALLIALAMVWPQGFGDRSPGPFGHTPVQRTPQMQAAMKRETEAAARRAGRGGGSSVGDITSQAVAPGQ